MKTRAFRRRAVTCAVAAIVGGGALGCEYKPPAAPLPPATIPAFVYVADDAGGLSQLVRFRNDSAVPLTGGANYSDPNSAASRLVFVSDEGGLPQVYISDLDVATRHLVTNTAAFASTPALSPHGDSIAFVSNRSGTSRIWLIAAPALNAVGFDSASALATGSPAYIPENAPAWSPVGGRIAFTSTSSGISQVYVVPSGGGPATVVTNELGGAISPTWSADGSTIYYIAATPLTTLRRISASGGVSTTVVTDTLGVGGPASCNTSVCLLVTSPADPTGAVSALLVSGDSQQVIFPRTAALERQPTILVP